MKKSTKSEPEATSKAPATEAVKQPAKPITPTGTPVLFVMLDGSVKWGTAVVTKAAKEVVDPKWTPANLQRLGYREAPKTIKTVKTMDYFLAPDFKPLAHDGIYKVLRSPAFSPDTIQEV